MVSQIYLNGDNHSVKDTIKIYVTTYIDIMNYYSKGRDFINYFIKNIKLINKLSFSIFLICNIVLQIVIFLALYWCYLLRVKNLRLALVPDIFP